MSPRLAWVRYGDPISQEELERAKGRFRAMVLAPWEEAAARALKEVDPSCTVLAYQCLSSVRTYEPGPRYSSGITPSMARRLGTFARREGEPVEWEGYPKHYQQQVWSKIYRDAWVENVVGWVKDSPFDGIMADNDVFDDYYAHGLNSKLLRDSLTALIHQAGKALRQVNRILVPNIAESRREPGRWYNHAQYGGGFEECWLGWGIAPTQRLSLEKDICSQAQCLRAPGLSIFRTPGTGQPGDPALELALAAAWLWAPESDVAVTATAHDGYGAMPLREEGDLGRAQTAVVRHDERLYSRNFERGWVAINLKETEETIGGVTLAPFTGRVIEEP